MSDPEKPDFGAGIASGELAEGTLLAGTFDGEPIVLVRHGGRVCALSGECTHAGAPLETGVVIEGQLRCPWHHARFDLGTGEPVAAPAIEPLSCYEVEEAQGIIRVRGKSKTDHRDRQRAEGSPIVIVGGGAAGYACADMLARGDLGARVMLLSADADSPYDRTLCSKEYLSGAMEREECFLPALGSGDLSAPTVRSGTEVVAIDTANRVVMTAGGERIAYGTLVLATGAEPVMPDFAGSDGEAVHRLRTLADADRLIAAAEKAETVAILGASFIGLEVAASLVRRGRKVVVVTRERVPLAAIWGEEAGRFVQRLHEDKGVRFHLGRTLGGYDGTSLTLDDGTMIATDLLVVGTGVKPRTGLAEVAGIALADDGDGILVDPGLSTSVDGIYAIGDVAAYPDARLGRTIRVEHWVHAQRQGQYLARRLLGQVKEGFADTPFFWSAHYDKSLHHLGHASPEDRRIEGSVEEGDFAIMFCEGGEDRALLTCGRDIQSLETEAQWDHDASVPS